jgi:hypothetical protein
MHRHPFPQYQCQCYLQCHKSNSDSDLRALRNKRRHTMQIAVSRKKKGRCRESAACDAVNCALRSGTAEIRTSEATVGYRQQRQGFAFSVGIALLRDISAFSMPLSTLAFGVTTPEKGKEKEGKRINSKSKIGSGSKREAPCTTQSITIAEVPCRAGGLPWSTIINHRACVATRRTL